MNIIRDNKFNKYMFLNGESKSKEKIISYIANKLGINLININTNNTKELIYKLYEVSKHIISMQNNKDLALCDSNENPITSNCKLCNKIIEITTDNITFCVCEECRKKLQKLIKE